MNDEENFGLYYLNCPICFVFWTKAALTIGRQSVQKSIFSVFVLYKICGEAVGYHDIRSLNGKVVRYDLIYGLLSQLYFLSLALDK